MKRNHAQEEKVMVRRNKALSHEVAELRDYTHKIHKQLKVCRYKFTQCIAMSKDHCGCVFKPLQEIYSSLTFIPHLWKLQFCTVSNENWEVGWDN